MRNLYNKIYKKNSLMFASGMMVLLSMVGLLFACQPEIGGIGSRVYVVERTAARLAVVDYRRQELLHKIDIPGNLRHASMVFDADLRYGYLALRDGVLARVDLQSMELAGVLQTSQNSIGLAISQDGRTIAVSEYKPGGITFVDVASWQVVHRQPAMVDYKGKRIQSRVTGLVDAPDGGFVCALMDADEIWYLQPDGSSRHVSKSAASSGLEASEKDAQSFAGYKLHRVKTAVPLPFDALITPDTRYYITGHMESRRASVVDLQSWPLQARVLNLESSKANWSPPPKMPHMEAWGVAAGHIFIPVPGEKRLQMLDASSLETVRSLKMPGYPVYAVVRPDQRQIWVTFSGEDHDGDIMVLDAKDGKELKYIKAGKRIYHLAFSPRGDQALVASNLSNELIFYDTRTFKDTRRISLDSPSGIFGAWRAFQIGL